MDPILEYAVPIPMFFGAGAVSRLSTVARRLGVSRAVVITDAGVRRSGLVDRAAAALGEVEIGIFDRVSTNPREEDVLAALRLYRSMDSGGDSRTGIVAFGGGSVIDAAKAVGLLASHGGSLTDYDLASGGAERIVRALPPIISVPTTAGTGSEVSRGSLIVTRREDVVRKTVVAGPRLVPAHAVLDPELTLELPPALTAGTGMDAVSHAIEEFSSPRYHPVVASIALQALRRLARDLPAVMRDPTNVRTRGDMLLSAMMAGIGFEKGLGVIHSLSHAIGALHDIHHGTLNATLLPRCLEFNQRHYRAGVLEEMAVAIGARPASRDRALDRLVGWAQDLNGELGIPPRLRDLGIPQGDRDVILDRALDDHCHRTNARPCKLADLRELWDRVW